MIEFVYVRSEWWEGQNKRTGDVGEFPEIVFSLLPLRPVTTNNTAPSSGAKQTSQPQGKTDSGNNVVDQPLIDLGNLASFSIGVTTGDSVPAKPSPFSNWTTFESTTDLQQATTVNPVSSADGKITQDDVISAADKSTLRKCSDSAVSCQPSNSIPKCSSENFDDRRHAVMISAGRNAGCEYDAEVDVPDSVLLLPVVSHGSVSEPCSPAHAPGVENPNLLVTGDSVCFTNDGDTQGVVYSLPAGNMSDRLSWMTSASCENLNSGVAAASHGNRLCSRSQFDEHLGKASSDISIFGASAPPVPPRDYPSRHASGDAVCRHRSLPKSHAIHQHTEIHPIVQDGQRRSSTHYWLLPEKQRFDPLPMPCEGESEHISYVNVPETRSMREKSARKAATKPKPSLATAAEISHSQMDDMMKKLDIGMADRPLESMSEIQDKVELIRADVGFDAVTFEESLNALSLNHWFVQDAVQYIKIEHLFRLGIASRDVCREALIAFQWDLQKAASCLVDRQSASADHTH